MMLLHGMCQSGNTYKVALALQWLGLPWQARFVDYFNGATRDPAWRARYNAMGEVPVLELPAAADAPPQMLSQSGAILSWLAEREGRLGGRDADQRREVLRWLLYDNHKFTSFFATWRFMKSFGATPPDPAVAAFLKTRYEGAFGVVNQHLAGRAFLVGDQPSIADCSLCGYLFFPPEESGVDVAAQYPHIGAWLARLRAQPGWQDPYALLPGERIAPRW